MIFNKKNLYFFFLHLQVLKLIFDFNTQFYQKSCLKMSYYNIPSYYHFRLKDIKYIMQ
ncbi:hypothetical protein pb186bvf_020190 [Paramecium bursaria]